jgi:hypothetical protein
MDAAYLVELTYLLDGRLLIRSARRFTTRQAAEQTAKRWVQQARLPGERGAEFTRTEAERIRRGYRLYQLQPLAERDPLGIAANNEEA